MKAFTRPGASQNRRFGGTRPYGWVALLMAAAFVWIVPTHPGAQGQGTGRSREELVAKLAGKKVRVDKSTGQLREITTEEAQEFVDSIARMTALAEATPQLSPGATAGRMLSLGEHLGHVVIARPSADGASSLRCVGSADEAVAFLTEEPDDR